ncbi:rhodanese family protein [Marinilactibacillus psychrotolerans 42ea]|uniref:Rhodanese family protein n=1 Tax=Marinilactibacillus psychrotolerans 42ea TaxID=1255609 RepID=A0A1R4JHI2_9LACT|nr:rhodanese-like domain-containing protein [Marinilactibacillus psychrotolerans]SJN31691.1 rhodanese family protein [Marinilactibacillus psychrotolerans 42ea]
MYNSISMNEFEKKWANKDIKLIDVREQDEWDAGHLNGAQHFPLSELAELKDKLDHKESYYVMCHSGGRSAAACDFLSKEGYNVTNVLGGISAWRGETV